MQKRFLYSGLCLLLGLMAFHSCKNEGKGGSSGFSLFSGDFMDSEVFADRLASGYQPVNAQDSSFRAVRNKDINVAVNYAYQLNENRPLWMNDRGVTKNAEQLVNGLKLLKLEGIGNDDQIRSATSIVDFLKKGKGIPVDTLMVRDKELTCIYMTAARDLLMGEDFNKIDNQWFVENDSVFFGPEALVHMIKSKELIAPFDTFRSGIKEYRLILEEIKHWNALAEDEVFMSMKSNWHGGAGDTILSTIIAKELRSFDAELIDSLSGIAAAIAKYQQFFNLKPTGKLDDATVAQLKKQPAEYISKLEVNLKRLRRLPRELGDHYVWVNIPLMELDYYQEYNNKFHSRVIVGKPARATPSISSPMTNIVFNPPWGVPPTILKNDVGPGVSKAGGGYLAKKGLRAYDSRGRDVTSQVNGSNYKKYFISQPPGARNALGELKFNMPNKEAIYIHDTPDRGNFKNSYRALSSGCVRTENPKQFAEMILGTDSFSVSSIEKIITTRRTRSKELDKKIPVYIIYLTVAPDKTGKGLRYLSDIYGRDKKMIEAKKA